MGVWSVVCADSACMMILDAAILVNALPAVVCDQNALQCSLGWLG